MEIPAIIQEWLIPDCGAMTSQEKVDQEKSYIAKMLEPEYLNSQSDGYLRYLDNKEEQIRFCNFRRLTMERYRLALEAPLARLNALPAPKP